MYNSASISADIVPQTVSFVGRFTVLTGVLNFVIRPKIQPFCGIRRIIKQEHWLMTKHYGFEFIKSSSFTILQN